MVAPVDARATVTAGDETFELAFNFRTIALAEDARPDVVSGMSGTPKLSSMAVLVWAFAQPAHPDLTLDQAVALCMDHGTAVGTALAKLMDRGAAKGDGVPRPPQKRPSRSTP